jgi:hypothetical protein
MAIVIKKEENETSLMAGLFVLPGVSFIDKSPVKV